ncbi:MAG: aminoacyl-tRNA hydrolase [Actinobacteria bacterium]|nr:aminoacyl-tRNA hydrolase [Actinomycetota bacterium]NIS37025.1 aminoacyl-tRNA hydrolase [Actinomycetota bacterium]NIT99043.1 aminoacyl-tRNA hydrolase [Actinomycetota bacterium]NIU22659.1 aminoacyl-tRNA hydrolase [Actinomycetota bacterium]NIU71487.1 aminoacyl-tRNA hydrolase [Actinomycetota bacterium]
MVRRSDTRRGTPADLLAVGLGNPGDEYAQTRHNAGSWVIHELVRRHGGRLARGRRGPFEADELRIGERRLAVAVPTTYMNQSGRAVAPLVRRHGIDDLARLVIVHDEIDLPVGRLRVKFGGGLAGNNGLKSIRSHLRTADFTRIRIGVGKPEPGTMKGADYVLRRPARSERPELDRIVGLAADAVEFLLDHDVEETMNRFNGS